MLKARVRLVGALVLGAALAFPIAASAQQPAPAQKAASPTPPVTAPTKDVGNVPAAPQPSVAPKPAAGSTASGCAFLRNQPNRPFFSPLSELFLSSLEPNMCGLHLEWAARTGVAARKMVGYPSTPCPPALSRPAPTGRPP